MKKDKYEWNIKCTTPSDYELTLTLHTTNRLLKYIFQQSKTKLSRSKQIRFKGSPDELTEFDIHPNYLKLIKTNINPILKKETKNFKKDGIQLLTYEVISCKFIKNGEKWDIKVYIEGVYIDKR